MNTIHTHDDTAGDIPQALCRLCHPELNMSAEQRQALDDADRARAKHEAAVLAKRRQIETTERRLNGLLGRSRALTPVGDKIATGLEKKLGRLRRELDALEVA